MNTRIASDSIFESFVFCDESSLFRSPSEPETGDLVTLRIRLMKDSDAEVLLLAGDPPEEIQMKKEHSDALFDWYQARVYCPDHALVYMFQIRYKGSEKYLTRAGIKDAESGLPDPAVRFCMIPGFHVPAWSKGSLQYQIFPDRFCNGNPENDVNNREYYYAGGHIRHADSWEEMPGEDDYRCFYGGDLSGILSKLDYLASLGVETIYLNPVFLSPSPHKYDTQDYEHIDPHLGVIRKDGGSCLKGEEKDNLHASRYRIRTTEEENLKASDEYFAYFCKTLHERGMKIILDGVFNHCGSFHRWLDREGIYRKAGGYPAGAIQIKKSTYRDYFRFSDDQEYESWYGFETLPKLNYEGSEELEEEILRIAEKWVSAPYYADGWRLDVGADLGHSPEVNHSFWKKFRQRVKHANPDALILAEHYGDPSQWLKGDEWDTVMNYDAFMEPLSFFLTGMEKHSDFRRDDLYQNGHAFFESMKENMARFPQQSLQCAMNELSNHDHSRFFTRTNGQTGRLHSAGNGAASEGVLPAVFREGVLIQMTWPGAPTIYYGDEAGLTGWTDPDNRRTYPWGSEDKEMIEYHRELAALRRRMPVLKSGSIQFLCAGYGFFAFARFSEAEIVVICCNNLDEEQMADIPVSAAGITDGTEMIRCFYTGEDGYSNIRGMEGKTGGGFLHVVMPAKSAMVLEKASGKEKVVKNGK